MAGKTTEMGIVLASREDVRVYGTSDRKYETIGATLSLKSGGDQWRRQDLVSVARRSRRRRREHRRVKGAEWGRVWGGVSPPQPTWAPGGAS